MQIKITNNALNQRLYQECWCFKTNIVAYTNKYFF